MNARNIDPATSHEAAASSVDLARKLRDRILQLAKAAAWTGITIAEGAEAIPERRASSITPRFSELVERGQLVRTFVGMGKPTKRFPAGRPLYETRLDEQTRKRVLLHWLPEFAPSPEYNELRDKATLVSEGDPVRGEVEAQCTKEASEIA